MLVASIAALIVSLLMPHGRRQDVATTKFGIDEARRATEAGSADGAGTPVRQHSVRPEPHFE